MKINQFKENEMKKKILSLLLVTTLILSNTTMLVGATEEFGEEPFTNHTAYPQEWIKVGPGTDDYILVQGGVVIDSKEGITTANIPETYNEITIGRIWPESFRTRLNLTTLSIPSTVFDVAWDMVIQSTKLQAITLSGSNEYLSVENGVLYNKDKTTLMVYPSGKQDTSFEIKTGVTTVSPLAFYSNPHLETVTVSSSNKNFVEQDGKVYATGSVDNALFPYGANIENGEGELVTGNYVYTANGNIKYMDYGTFVTQVGYRTIDRTLAEWVQVGPGENDWISVAEGAILEAHDDIEIAIIPEVVNGEEVWGDFHAFSNKSKLTKLVYPSTMVHIGGDSGINLPKIKEVEIVESNNYVMVENGVAYGDGQRTISIYPAGKTDETFEIKAGIKWAYSRDFADNPYLREVTVEAGNEYFEVTEGVVHEKGNPSNVIFTNKTVEDNEEIPQVEEQMPQVNVETQYSDIKVTDWHYEAVSFAVETGLFGGTSDNSFEPEKTMSKAMIWTVLYRNSGGTGETTGANWYEASQSWVVDNELSSGDNALNDMTREELAILLYKLENSPTVETEGASSFADSQHISENATDAMNWAVGVGLYQGNLTNTLNPTGTATRAEVATILMRYLG